MKIGLVGESPHDTTSVKNLLSRIYPELEFINLIHNIHGSQLDQLQPTKNRLRKEYEWEKPDLVVFIRDLDALKKDITQLRKRAEYFREFRTVVDNRAVFLLFIFEIEAMILCDIGTFNQHYGTAEEPVADPHDVTEPKERLKLICKKYNESHNPELFGKLDTDLLANRSADFNAFLRKFERYL